MSDRGRRNTRLSGFLAVFAMLAALLPALAFSGVANAAAPPVQDTTAFCAGGPTGNPFPDVTDPSDPHYANIACAKDAGIVQGKTDGLYHPDENTSRAQMASLLAREADKSVSLAAPGKTLTPLPAAGSNPFQDVGDPPPDGGPSTAPHTDNILRLVAAGITNGTDSTHYSPANDVTRFQMAKFEVLKLEFITGTTLDASCGATFPDGAETDATFGTFVEKAACAGIIQGKADGSFHGSDTLSRAQTATFDIRGMAYLLSKGFITPLHGTPSNNQFTVTCTPAAPAAVTVSGTKGTATGDQAKLTCQIPDSAGTKLAVSLLPSPVQVQSPIGQLFVDNDGNSRADCSGTPQDAVATGICVEPSNGFGPLHAFIQSANGVTQPNETTQTLYNLVPGAGGQITLEVNDRTPNEQYNILVWNDQDNNGYFNVTDVTGFPVGTPNEPFGLSGTISVIPPEQTTGFNCAAGLGVALFLPDQNLFTANASPCGPAATYKFGTGDTYQYDSGTVGGPPPGFTITQAQFEDYLSQAGLPNATTAPILGDTLFVFYNPGTSTFRFLNDVPKMVTGVTAAASDADHGGTSDDITVNWTDVTNPDVAGYQVWRAVVGPSGAPGAYACVGGCGGPSGVIPKTATSFNDLGADSPGAPFPPASGVKYAFQVFAVNTAGNTGPNQPIPATAMVTAVTSTAVPFEAAATMTQHTPASGAQPGTTFLAGGDSFLLTFTTPAPLTVTSGATLSLQNHEAQSLTLTNGGNATFTVTGPNSDHLNIAITGAQGVPLAGNFDLDFANCCPGNGPPAVAFTGSTGIGNSNGNVNWARSGLISAVGPPNTTNNRTLFENSQFTTNCCGFYDGSNNGSLPPPIPVGAVTVNTSTHTVTIAAGLSNTSPPAAGPIDIVNNDTITLYDKNGVSLGTTTYNNTSGATITSSSAFAAGDVLYLVYTDNGTGSMWGSPTPGLAGPSGLPSATTGGFNPSNKPVVCDNFVLTACGPAPIGTGTVADPLNVTWSVPATETGPASNYTVRDSSNSALVATATTVKAPNGSTAPAVCPTPPAAGTCTFSLTLDHALVPGTTYTLDVAASTVQHTGVSNTPNDAQSVLFTAANNPPPPVPPAITSAAIGVTTKNITVTFNQAVTCPITAGDAGAWVFNEQYTGPGAAGAVGPFTGTAIAQPTATTCTVTFGGLAANFGTNDFGTLNYNQPAAVGDRVSSPNGQVPATANTPVPDASNPTFASVANAHTTTTTVTYAEPIVCSTVDANGSDYTVTVGGGADSVVSATCTVVSGGQGTVVTLTLLTAPVAGQTVTVTAKNGTDGSTAADQFGNTQPVGDSTSAAAT